MSEWTHNIVVVVPENLTFQQADFAVKSIADSITQYQNEDGELVDSVEKIVSYGAERYAVANTRAVEKIMDYFALVPAELSVNVVFPVIVDDALTGGDMAKIQVFVDQDPFYVLDLLGLARV